MCVAICDAGRRVVAWGGSVMSYRAAGCAVSGTRDETHGEMRGRDEMDEMRGGAMNAPFLSARFGRSHVVITPRGILGELSAFSTVE